MPGKYSGICHHAASNGIAENVRQSVACCASKAAGDPSLKGSGGCGLEEAGWGVGARAAHVAVAAHGAAGQGAGARPGGCCGPHALEAESPSQG